MSFMGLRLKFYQLAMTQEILKNDVTTSTYDVELVKTFLYEYLETQHENNFEFIIKCLR